MTRTTGPALVVTAFVLAATGGIAAQKVIYESEAKIVTATIELIDPSTRLVTLKTEAGNRLHVTAPREMEGFNRMKPGDIVTAKYFDAVALRLARPGSPTPSSEPTITVRRKDDTPGGETMSERTVRARISAVQKDPAAPLVIVKGDDGLDRAMAVTDTAQLNALQVGDTVDVTFYESRLVSVERPKK
jgi:Cu/Ag efflux protein CusF